MSVFHEQRICVKFCVKIGKSVTETCTLTPVLIFRASAAPFRKAIRTTWNDILPESVIMGFKECHVKYQGRVAVLCLHCIPT